MSTQATTDSIDFNNQRVTDAQRTAVRDAIAAALTSVYHCSRTWSAWSHGTMSEADFTPAAEDENILDELTDVAIAAMSEPVVEGASVLADPHPEVLPGATKSEIQEVMMQDIVGDYDVPETVPEWAWVEKNASFAHTGNGENGVWDFVLNLGLHFEDIPEKLKPVIDQARADHMVYLLFHQGT